jgi:hypothetical protein
MDLVQNAALREQGWRVFRSASRNHLIPLHGPGGSLQRIKIAQALAVSGVFEGVAISDEERKAQEEQRRLGAALAEREAVGRPLGVTQYLAFDMAVIDGTVDPANPFLTGSRAAIAPFDGFITEFVVTDTGATPFLAIGIRSSGGATMFRSTDPGLAPPPLFRIPPDLIRVGLLTDAAGPVALRNLKMPVFAGEEIKVIFISPGATPLGTFSGSGILGFEAFILARPGSAAAVSMFGALTVESRRAATEAAAQSSRLAIEQEQTRRSMGADAARVEVAKLNLEAKRPAGQPQFNPFQNLLLLGNAQQQLTSRAPTPAPAPRVSRPPAQAPDGAGQTFVSAWNPSFGSIGYLVPDPPRGGKVNVFDNKYTIWDISGKNVGSGSIVPVATDSQIPPGARISGVLRTTKSAGLLQDTATEFS